MATTVDAGKHVVEDPAAVRRYLLAVTAVFALIVVPRVVTDGEALKVDMDAVAAFAVATLLADILKVQFWSQMSFTLSLPVSLAAGMVLLPWQAAVVAFVSVADLDDFRGRIPLSRAVFNRAEIGLAVLAGSTCFHWLSGGELNWPSVILPSIACLLVDAAVNTALIVWPISKMRGISALDVPRRMFGPSYSESVLRYVCVGLTAPLIATVWLAAGAGGLLVFLLPLALARFAFAQAEQLREAADRIDAKNEALASMLDETANERRDERITLAAALHDDVLPALFKVQLMAQVIRQDIDGGHLLRLDEDVPHLQSATESAQQALRALVGNLRTSPIGPLGLSETLRLAAQRLESVSDSRFGLDLSDASASQATQLVIYEVAKEAMTNAAMHSKSRDVEVRLWTEDGVVRLIVRDHGTGFDRDLNPPHGHYGLLLMAERAEAIGGRLVIDSVIGSGTTVALVVHADG